MSAAAERFGRAETALTIRRARLHKAVAGDLPKLRARLEDIRPSALGIADSALLLVPRLAVGRRLARGPDGGGFAGAVSDALRSALRRARRPGEPGSADDPLLFVDENEAAATLIGQWLEGASPGDRDWWPLLTAGAPAPLWWRRQLLPDARRLPAIVALLAGRGLADAWLRRLEPEEIGLAVGAITETYGLPRREWRRGRRATAAGPGEPVTAIAEALALVDSFAPEARQPDLSAPARLLLILALVAERRPALLGTRAARAAFAAAAAEALPLADQPPERRFRQRRPPAATKRPRPSPAPRPEADPPQAPSATLAVALAGRQRATAEAAPPGQDSAAALPTPERRPWPSVDRSAPAPADAVAPAHEIETDFGGLLFLLNALLALGLYGDFSRPGHALAGLSPFGLLRLLGRAWFGRRFIDDPLHGLLVGLAGGRSADTPRHFEARSWSVPRTWLSPWSAAGPATIGGHPLRPMLWHEAGFPLAELDPEDSDAAAMRAARRLGLRRTVRRARHPFLPAPARARWVTCLRLYLEARLARALRSGGGAEAAAALCRRPARIALEGEALTARFMLHDHPIAIRAAGLDRDPGWIPAARRDVRYAFQ
jgi:hypothetical protein